MISISFRIGVKQDYKKVIEDFKTRLLPNGLPLCDVTLETRQAKDSERNILMFNHDLTGYLGIQDLNIETLAELSEEFMKRFDKDDVVGARLTIKNRRSEKGMMFQLENINNLKETIIYNFKRA